MNWALWWAERKWKFVHLGTDPGSTAAFVWIFATAVLLFPVGLLFARLFGPIGVGAGFGLAVVIGELIALPSASWLRERAGQAEHARYALWRVLQVEDRHEVRARLSKALVSVAWFAKAQLGNPDFDIFFLRPIREPPELPEAERPGTFGEVRRAVWMDLMDRIATDGPPWESIRPVLTRAADTLGGEGDVQALREVISDIYRRTSPWYRARAIRFPPGPFERHPLLRDVLIYVVGPSVAAIVFAVFASK